MNRISRGMIIGGVAASAAGLLWRSSRNNRIIGNRSMNRYLNGTLNSTISLLDKTGLFRIMGRSRLFRRMVR
ncbi:MAG: hypothetical protein AB7V16_02605 [Vulcanibacillus sp.]